MIKAVLFDIDNTLTWTEENYILDIHSRVLERIGGKDWSKEDKLLLWYGYNRRKFLADKGVIDVDKFWETFTAEDTERINYTHLFDDAKIVIPQLKHRGFKIGFVTGAHKDIAEKIISLLEEKIDSLIVANDLPNGINPKPDPASINCCLKELNVSNENAVYVGNGEEDILAARNANVLDVLVERKTHPLEIKVQPTIRIKSLYELFNLIKYL